MGNPGVFQANLHLYPWKPVLVTRGTGLWKTPESFDLLWVFDLFLLWTIVYLFFGKFNMVNIIVLCTAIYYTGFSMIKLIFTTQKK